MTKQKRRKRPIENNRKHRSGFSGKSGGGSGNEAVWLWGVHAVQAALGNPDRQQIRLLATANAARKMTLSGAEEATSSQISRLLPPGAVHQGVALSTHALPALSVEDVIERAIERIAVLDQVSDPHNLGAVMRSAAAFGVGAILMQTRHTPPITGIAAKTAAGAVEQVPEVRVVNVARALETLGKAGYTVIGLAGEADTALADALPAQGSLALVFGAEGDGLRPSVAKACSWLAKIPMTPGMESLNISNAAAISFYEAARQKHL